MKRTKGEKRRSTVYLTGNRYEVKAVEDRQTDRQTDRHRQTDRQTDRQTNRQTDR